MFALLWTGALRLQSNYDDCCWFLSRPFLGRSRKKFCFAPIEKFRRVAHNIHEKEEDLIHEFSASSKRKLPLRPWNVNSFASLGCLFNFYFQVVALCPTKRVIRHRKPWHWRQVLHWPQQRLLQRGLRHLSNPRKRRSLSWNAQKFDGSIWSPEKQTSGRHSEVSLTLHWYDLCL